MLQPQPSDRGMGLTLTNDWFGRSSPAFFAGRIVPLPAIAYSLRTRSAFLSSPAFSREGGAFRTSVSLSSCETDATQVGGAARSATQRLEDHLHHSLDILHHIPIPEAQHAKAPPLKDAHPSSS